MKKELGWRLFILVLVLPVALGLMINCSEESDDSTGPGDGEYTNPPASIMGTWHLFGLIEVQTGNAFDGTEANLSVYMRMVDDICRYTSYENLEAVDNGTVHWTTQDNVEYMIIESDSMETDTTMQEMEFEVVSHDDHLINMIGVFEDDLDEDIVTHWLMANGGGFYGFVAESGMLSPPIEGATVTLEDMDGEFVTVDTDEYGVYSFPDYQSGDFYLLASYTDFETQSRTVMGNDTEPVMQNFYLIPSDGGGGGEDPLGTVYGTVTDYSTGSPILGAVIYCETGQYTVTDSNGEYTLDVYSGTRDFVVSAAGYQTFVTTVDVIAESSTEASFELTAGVAGVGTLEGYVTDSQTGYGLESVLVQMDDYSVYTDSYGYYSFMDVDAGYHVVSVVLTGYYTQINEIIVPAGETVQLNFTMSPELTGGELRLVLSWGAEPHDLDSHLLVPVEGQEYPDHVYFGDRGYSDQPPYAQLDVDDVSGYGPETITIFSLYPGTYYYYIYKYSGEGDIAGCGAVVRVYDETGQIYELNVPQPQVGEEGYRYWDVLQIVDGSIVITNDILIAAPGPEFYNFDDQQAKVIE